MLAHRNGVVSTVVWVVGTLTFSVMLFEGRSTLLLSPLALVTVSDVLGMVTVTDSVLNSVLVFEIRCVPCKFSILLALILTMESVAL